MTLTDLEKRLEDLEDETRTECKYGERPPELTDEEREMLDEAFSKKPFSDTDLGK